MMFTLDELKLIMFWYECMHDQFYSGKNDDALVDKIDKIIAEMEEQI
jgi:hypothetical protein